MKQEGNKLQVIHLVTFASTLSFPFLSNMIWKKDKAAN